DAELPFLQFPDAGASTLEIFFQLGGLVSRRDSRSQGRDSRQHQSHHQADADRGVGCDGVGEEHQGTMSIRASMMSPSLVVWMTKAQTSPATLAVVSKSTVMTFRSTPPT